MQNDLLRTEWSESGSEERGFAIMMGIHGINPLKVELWDVRTETRFNMHVSGEDAVAAIRDHLAYVMCDPVSFAVHPDRAGFVAGSPWQQTNALDYISDVRLAPLSTWPSSYHTSDFNRWCTLIESAKKRGKWFAHFFGRPTSDQP